MKVKYVTMIIADMEESIKFYTEVMGLRIDSQYDLGPAGKITLLKGEGDAMIEIIQIQWMNPASLVWGWTWKT
jgi:lactoylglutathione lyase